MGRSKRNRDKEVTPDWYVPEYEDQISYEEGRGRKAERWSKRKQKRDRDDYEEDWDN